MKFVWQSNKQAQINLKCKFKWENTVENLVLLFEVSNLENNNKQRRKQ